MCSAHEVSAAAALFADPVRATILVALTDSAPRSVAELAVLSGVTPQTASSHLAKLAAAGFVTAEQEGRSRLYRLASESVVDAIQALGVVGARAKTVVDDLSEDRKAIRRARACYGHVGGNLGVKIMNRLLDRQLITPAGPKNFDVTPSGRAWFQQFGIDSDSLGEGHRGIARSCLDWSEREPHLGGPLADGLLSAFYRNGWFVREAGTRAIEITESGFSMMQKELQLTAEALGPGAQH